MNLRLAMVAEEDRHLVFSARALEPCALAKDAVVERDVLDHAILVDDAVRDDRVVDRAAIRDADVRADDTARHCAAVADVHGFINY